MAKKTTIFKNILEAFVQVKNMAKPIFLSYLIQTVLAMPIGYGVFSALQRYVGSSLEMEKLQQGFDYTVIRDFLSQADGAISGLIDLILPLVLVYFFVATFLQAGLFAGAVQRRYAISDFFRNAKQHFLVFLGIGILATLSFLIPAALLLGTWAAKAQSSIEFFPDERYTIGLLGILLFFLAIWFVFIFLWSLSARKARLHNENLGVLSAISLGFREMRNRKLDQWGIVSLLMAFLLGFVFLGNVMLSAIPRSTALGLFSVVLIQQVLVLGRISWRTWVYAAISGR